jgi:hypothetical protein
VGDGGSESESLVLGDVTCATRIAIRENIDDLLGGLGAFLPTATQNRLQLLITRDTFQITLLTGKHNHKILYAFPHLYDGACNLTSSEYPP